MGLPAEPRSCHRACLAEAHWAAWERACLAEAHWAAWERACHAEAHWAAWERACLAGAHWAAWERACLAEARGAWREGGTSSVTSQAYSRYSYTVDGRVVGVAAAKRRWASDSH